MSSLQKHSDLIDRAAAAMLSRAEDRRGLEITDVRPRLDAAVRKYLPGEALQPAEIKEFVDQIRADDLCLIIACERGDERAWEDLVAQFDSTVKSAARKISLNNEDAEDLAGSIWAELYGLRQDAEGNKKSKLAYYSGRGSLGGWLRAVVSQLAVDQFRKQSKFVQIEEDREFDNLAEASSNNADNSAVLSHTDNPEHIFSEKQTAADVATALKHAIESLKADDRLILKLYYFDDLKLKDLAKTFGYHEATASRKVARLHSDIRKAVETRLREQHGWNDSEVKRCLSDMASKLGISFEKLFAAMLIAAVLQDFYLRGVL